MPFHKITPTNQYQTVFISCGPWCEENRSMADDLCLHFLQTIAYRTKRAYGPCFEISKDGYQHIHMVVESLTCVRWAKQMTLLLGLTRTWNKHRNTQPQHPNIWFGNIPKTESTTTNNFDHIGVKYLRDSTKLKMTDDTVEVVEFQYDEGILTHSYILQAYHVNETPQWCVQRAIAMKEERDKKLHKDQLKYRKWLMELYRHSPSELKERLAVLDGNKG